jgi:Glycosyltransferase like family
MTLRVRVVCATRESKESFRSTALGRSLALYPMPILQLRLFDRNTRGLPAVYNEAILEARSDPALLVFVHDDVYLADFYWVDYLLQALSIFDVVGVAGNRRRVPWQPSWCFINEQFETDKPENLSGVVAHGRGFPPEAISYYGPSRQPVKLLDGLFLAARSETLLSKGLRFDERFDFHFYDLDFCRQAEALNLRMGTWSISLIHESGGAFGSPGWRAGYAKYLDKWRE